MGSKQWGAKVGLRDVGDLNDRIVSAGPMQLILLQEAYHEQKIAEIAKQIVENPDRRIVMIAGPSSSSKTTFSHRLSAALAIYGITPHPIPVDDYFVDREKTPKDADGNYNFECLEAIDVEQFNKDMLGLIEGKEVELPTFNFKTGKREYKNKKLKLGTGDIMVIEGIHCLNDALSYALPAESKFKIYISALTQLSVDNHDPIPTTDGRLIRRIVRDARTRGTGAAATIAMWPSVRRGEEDNIFPFQESADVVFNSALIYELAVLKVYAEPLLFGIDRSSPEYIEAKRLLKFLDYFVPISSEQIPMNSLVREFIGGSCFDV
jgi:uridine kinase